MNAITLLQELEQRGIEVSLTTNGKLRVESGNPIPAEVIEQLKVYKQELILALQPSITLEACRQRRCQHLFDHRPNPRCIHPLCTKGGKYPSGLPLGMLVECPEVAGKVVWKH